MMEQGGPWYVLFYSIQAALAIPYCGHAQHVLGIFVVLQHLRPISLLCTRQAADTHAHSVVVNSTSRYLCVMVWHNITVHSSRYRGLRASETYHGCVCEAA